MLRRGMHRCRYVSGISGTTAWGRYLGRCSEQACGSSSCTSFPLPCGPNFRACSAATMVPGASACRLSSRCCSLYRRASRRERMTDTYTIRVARQDDLAILPIIERAAAAVFRATPYAYLADDDLVSAEV